MIVDGAGLGLYARLYASALVDPLATSLANVFCLCVNSRETSTENNCSNGTVSNAWFTCLRDSLPCMASPFNTAATTATDAGL